MGYAIRLVNPQTNECYEVPPHREGGIIQLGGNPQSWISITYNHSKYFYRYIDKEEGIRWLYGKPAGDTIYRLIKAINRLKTFRDEDYWKTIAGNAGHALATLLLWAIQWPKGIWKGD